MILFSKIKGVLIDEWKKIGLESGVGEGHLTNHQSRVTQAKTKQIQKAEK